MIADEGRRPPMAHALFFISETGKKKEFFFVTSQFFLCFLFGRVFCFSLIRYHIKARHCIRLTIVRNR